MNYSEEVLGRAKMAVEIGQAVLEGKVVLSSNKGENNFTMTRNPSFQLSSYDYKVKPEPTYIPFTFEDAKDLIGKSIINGHVTSIVLEVGGEGVRTISRKITYQELLSCWTFEDESRCGKLVSE